MFILTHWDGLIHNKSRLEACWCWYFKQRAEMIACEWVSRSPSNRAEAVITHVLSLPLLILVIRIRALLTNIKLRLRTRCQYVRMMHCGCFITRALLRHSYFGPLNCSLKRCLQFLNHHMWYNGWHKSYDITCFCVDLINKHKHYKGLFFERKYWIIACMLCYF